MSAANLRIFFQLRGLSHHKYSLFFAHRSLLFHFYHGSAFAVGLYKWIFIDSLVEKSFYKFVILTFSIYLCTTLNKI